MYRWRAEMYSDWDACMAGGTRHDGVEALGMIRVMMDMACFKWKNGPFQDHFPERAV